MKDKDLDPNESGARNPYRVLLHKLTGTELLRPPLKTPANVWRRTHREQIETNVTRQAAASGWNKKKLAPLRERIAKQIFGDLPQQEKEDWERLAKEEYEDALEQYNNDIKSCPATDPASRQRYVLPSHFLGCDAEALLSCIQALTLFVTPILDLICEATGWKASLIAGGPEPAHAGRLNVLWYVPFA